MLSDSHHKHHKNQPANESDQSFAEMMQEPVKFIRIKENWNEGSFSGIESSKSNKHNTEDWG